MATGDGRQIEELLPPIPVWPVSQQGPQAPRLVESSPSMTTAAGRLRHVTSSTRGRQRATTSSGPGPKPESGIGSRPVAMIESAAVIRGVREKTVLSALGLSRRTVVRLGALLARGLAFTETVLESAEKGSPLEKLILSDALRAAAPDLSSEKLTSLCADAGIADALTVLETGKGRTVALEEEVEAEGAWEAPSQEEAGSLARLARAPALTPSAPGGEARAELFTAAEIEKLKLTALTSARAEEAIGAMRRLAYSPLSAQERGEIFVRALAALEPEVRAEASRLLAGVGLQPDISEALVSLAAGEEAEKKLAVDRLGQALVAIALHRRMHQLPYFRAVLGDVGRDILIAAFDHEDLTV